ncbi:MAG: transcriptional regulator NrdR [Proteobacteria bacterium]|nr:transcriptional repressor NrdR [Desulfobacula sp.]MBU3954257.1 transcriptional regulator NrdR [Pseudomonadota bacterium]MBU4133454.1 transcriptional regulator NrdR [Pseudomonadota bacterium]
MKCPYCINLNTRVVDSRPGKIEFEVRRRRECQICERRFTTYERVEQAPVMIIKKDGRREEFDREKVLRGIQKACEKRAISVNLIEEMVEVIEQELRESNEREIPSKIVGEKIIEALKAIDDVAYVRFASVYREFKDVADFIQELKGLLPKECQPVEFDHLMDRVTDKADDRS